MPFLRRILQGVAFAALLQFSAAAPTAPAPARVEPLKPGRAPSPTTAVVTTTPSLPVNSGGTQLPSPGNLTLSKIAIGRGVQNYTCATSNSTPVAIGALANLFDATTYATENPTAFNSLPALAVDLPEPTTTLEVGGQCFKYLGKHFFTSELVPTFDLSTVGDLLSAVKKDSVAAPATASVGPDGTGAVPWLYLVNGGGSVGLEAGYRVETAGGEPDAVCTEAGVMSIPYSAQYWFYE